MQGFGEGKNKTLGDALLSAYGDSQELEPGPERDYAVAAYGQLSAIASSLSNSAASEEERVGWEALFSYIESDRQQTEPRDYAPGPGESVELESQMAMFPRGARKRSIATEDGDPSALLMPREWADIELTQQRWTEADWNARVFGGQVFRDEENDAYFVEIDGVQHPLNVPRDEAIDEALLRFHKGYSGAVSAAAKGLDVGGLLTETLPEALRLNVLAGTAPGQPLTAPSGLRQRNVPSAAGRYPGIIPLARDEAGLIDLAASSEEMRDPLQMLGVSVRLGELQKEGRLETTFGEHFGSAAGFLAGFAGVTAGLKLGVWKPLAKAAGKLPGHVTMYGRITEPAKAAMRGVGGSGLPWAPGVRSILSFGQYGAVDATLRAAGEQVSNRDLELSKLAGDAGAGLGAGLAEGVFLTELGALYAAPARALLGRLGGGVLRRAGKTPREWVAKWSEVAREGSTADRATRAFMSRLPSQNPGVTRLMGDVLKDTQRLNTAIHLVDAAFVGTLLGAWGNARQKAGESWDSMGPIQRRMAMFGAIGSGEALASGAAFMLASGAHQLVKRTAFVKATDDPRMVDQLLRQVADTAANVAGPFEIDGAIKAFDAIGKERPDIIAKVAGARGKLPGFRPAVAERLGFEELTGERLARKQRELAEIEKKYGTGDLAKKKRAALQRQYEREQFGPPTIGESGVSPAEVARVGRRRGEEMEPYGPLGLTGKIERDEPLTPEEKEKLRGWMSPKAAAKRLAAELPEWLGRMEGEGRARIEELLRGKEPEKLPLERGYERVETEAPPRAKPGKPKGKPAPEMPLDEIVAEMQKLRMTSLSETELEKIGWETGHQGLLDALNGDRRAVGLELYAEPGEVPLIEAMESLQRRVVRDRGPQGAGEVGVIEELEHEIRNYELALSDIAKQEKDVERKLRKGEDLLSYLRKHPIVAGDKGAADTLWDFFDKGIVYRTDKKTGKQRAYKLPPGSLPVRGPTPNKKPSDMSEVGEELVRRGYLPGGEAAAEEGQTSERDLAGEAAELIVRAVRGGKVYAEHGEASADATEMRRLDYERTRLEMELGLTREQLFNEMSRAGALPPWTERNPLEPGENRADSLLAESAGPRDGMGHAERWEHASSLYGDAADVLRQAGMLGAEESARSEKAQELMRRAITGDQAIRDEFMSASWDSPETAAEMWSKLVDAAQQGDRHFILATFQAAREQGDINGAAVVHSYLRASEDWMRDGKITDETKVGLGKLGMLTPEGHLDSRAASVVGEWIYNKLTDPGLSMRRAPGGPEAGFFDIGLLNPIALLKRALPMSERLDEHSILQRVLNLRNAMRWADGADQRFSGNKGVRDFNRRITENFGRSMSAAGMPQMIRDNRLRFVTEIQSPRQHEANMARAQAAFVASTFGGPGTPWDHLAPPQRMREGVMRLIDKGYFRDGRITSPQDLERHLGPDSGYLYYAAERWNAHMRDMAKRAGNVGWLSEKQAEAERDQYVPHIDPDSYFKDEFRPDAGPGELDSFFAGRDMGRVRESESRVWDPDFLMRVVTSQEARHTQFIGTLQDIAFGPKRVGYRADEVAKMDPLTKEWLRPLALKRGEKDPINGYESGPLQHYLYLLVDYERRKMQSRAAFERGDPVPPGVKPFTKGKERLFEELVPTSKPAAEKQLKFGQGEPKEAPLTPSGEVGLYVDAMTLKDLEMLWDATFSHRYMPEPSLFMGSFELGDLATSMREGRFGDYLGERVDLAMRFAKRNWTVHRGTFWTVNLTSSLASNSRVVPWWDFVWGVMSGRGTYAWTARTQQEYVAWLRRGSPPGERNEGIEFWDKLSEQAGGGTLRSALMGSDPQTEVAGSMFDPEAARLAAERSILAARLQAQFKSGKHPLSVDEKAASMLAEAVFTHGEMQHASVEALDRKMAKWLGSTNTAERIGALHEIELQYNLMELFLKGAAVRAVMDTNPHLTADQAIAEGMKRTADYRDAPALVKRWTRSFNLGGSQIDRGKNYRGMRSIARAALSPAFALYKYAGTPVFISDMLDRPVRMIAPAAVLAMIGLAMDEFFDPAEGASYLTAMAGTRGNRGMDVLTREEMKLYGEKYGDNARPWLDDKLTVTAGVKKRLGRLWIKVQQGQPLVGALPGGGRVASFEELVPGALPVLEGYRAVRDAASMSGMEKAAALVDSFTGVIPSFVGGVYQTGKEIQSGLTGRTGSEHPDRALTRAAEGVANAIAGEFNPNTWMASRAMRRSLEDLHGGRTLQDIVVGQRDLFEQKHGPVGRLALGAALEQAIRVRKIPQSLSVGRIDDETMWDNMLKAVGVTLPGGGDPLRVQEAKQGSRIARDWLVDAMTQSYKYALQSGVPIEAALRSKLHVMEDVEQDPATGRMKIRDDPGTPFGTFLKGQSPAHQATALETFVKVLPKALSGYPMMNAITAANAKQIDPALFKRVIYTSLLDDSGVSLLARMRDDLIGKGRMDWAPDYYLLFTSIPRPSGDRGRDWDEVNRLFRRMGMAHDLNFPASRARMLDLLGPEAFDTGGRAARSALQEMNQR